METQHTAQSQTRDRNKRIDSSTLANWLWAASSKISKLVEPWERLRIISALLLYKRISDIQEDILSEQEVSDEDKSIFQFRIPDQLKWSTLRRSIPHQEAGKYLAEIFHGVARSHVELERVLDLLDYNQLFAKGSAITDASFRDLIEELGHFHIGLNVGLNELGTAYEEFLQKSFEQGGGYLGYLATPSQISRLIPELLNVIPNSTIYDPCCGSASLLVNTFKILERGHPSSRLPTKIYAEERSSTFYAIAKINLLLHGHLNGRFSKFCVSGDNQPFSLERTRLCHRLDPNCSTNC